MKRRDFLKTMGALTMGASVQTFAAQRPSGKQPNILFFFSDDHSLQTLGAYPSRMQNFIKKHNITPNIDSIADQGTLFENSFVGNSICGPSRATILTGKHSHINGFRRNGDKFDPNQWTVAKELQDAGYETSVIGKWHLGTNPTGFDHFQVLPGQGRYYNPDFIVPDERKRVRVDGYCSDIIGDLSVQWLDSQRDESKPFFLCSWHKAPHRTWMPHPRHFDLIEDVDVPEPDNLFDTYEGRTSSAREQEMTIADHINLAMDVKVTPPFMTTTAEQMRDAIPKTQSMDPSTIAEFSRMSEEQRQAWDDYFVPRNEAFRAQNLDGDALTSWKYQAYLKDYIRCVKAMDENIGNVMNYLEDNSLDRDTIVIYSSDQGFYNGEHGWYDKRWMYEESLRNPLVIKWPGVTEPGSRVSAMVQNIDYSPTLLDIAGASVPAAVQGASLVPFLENASAKGVRDSILYTYYERGVHAVERHRGVRNERYKLIEFYAKGEWEFYDLEKDPTEMRSQYDNPEYSDIIANMKTELTRLMTNYELDPDETD